MGLQRLSDKSVAKMNRKLGTNFVKAAAKGHPCVVEAVDAEDQHFYVDRCSGEVEPVGFLIHWTSCRDA